MNLDKLFVCAASIVLLFASIGKFGELQAWIWRSQAKIIYESRTETWGSPRFWPARKF